MKQKNGNDPNNTHFLNYPALSNGDRKKGVIRFLKNLLFAGSRTLIFYPKIARFCARRGPLPTRAPLDKRLAGRGAGGC